VYWCNVAVSPAQINSILQILLGHPDGGREYDCTMLVISNMYKIIFFQSAFFGFLYSTIECTGVERIKIYYPFFLLSH